MKHFFNQTPIKVLSAIVLFLLFTGLISFGIARPYDRIYSNENQYDLLFLGASETEWGINPNIIDNKLRSNSYLLATSGCTLDGRYEMLKAAIKQKSLKTVVIDVNYHCLTKNMNSFDLDKRVLYFSRVSGLDNKLQTAAAGFSFAEDEYDELYAEMIFEGSNAWKEIAKGSYPEYRSLRGYVPQGNTSQLLTKKQAQKTYNKKKGEKIRQRNVDRLIDIITLCRENDVKPIIITIPNSRRYLWQKTGWDTFHKQMMQLTEAYQVDYIDFNLLEDFSSYLPEETAFRDYEHLCDSGVTTFSRMLADFIAVYENDLSPEEMLPYRFYDSYKEAKEKCLYSNDLNTDTSK